MMMEIYLSICARAAAETADLLPISDCGSLSFPLHLNGSQQLTTSDSCFSSTIEMED